MEFGRTRSAGHSLTIKAAPEIKEKQDFGFALEQNAYYGYNYLMFDVKDSEPFDTDEDDFDTVLERDISFTGNIRFSKPFMIKGKMSGLIEATSDLLIDTDAEVEADITAERVLVRGKVKGNIKGFKMVYVTSTGSVNGEIASARPVLELGSTVNGKLTMLKDSDLSSVEKPDLFASGGF